MPNSLLSPAEECTGDDLRTSLIWDRHARGFLFPSLDIFIGSLAAPPCDFYRVCEFIDINNYLSHQDGVHNLLHVNDIDISIAVDVSQRRDVRI